MDYIIEPSAKLPITGNYDVVVAGGGVAGIAAALAAARQGAKVLLIEKQFMLGGLATLGLVTIYLPLCDGKGNQVSFGISEELIHLSMQHGYESQYPAPWLNNGTMEEKSRIRFQVRYNPNVFAIDCELLLLNEGVDILYGTSVCAVTSVEQKITSLIIENKSGRSAIVARSVVDATGDSDICKFAGAKTSMFQQGNLLAGWYYYTKDLKYHLKVLGASDIPDKYKDKYKTNPEQKRYTAIDADELTRMVIDSHQLTLNDFLKTGGITPEHNLTAVPTIPQVRMTRRIEGVYTLDDVETNTYFEDSIGMIGDWRKKGPVYEIPFRTLYGNEIKNLITAGRNISVTDAMWDITRVIPACAITGEAAGIASAMTDDFTSLDIKQLQQQLIEKGAVLHNPK